jgi:hypothetical protein
MQDLSDLQLDKSPDPAPAVHRSGWWRALLLLPLLAAVGYLVWNLVASRKPEQGVRVQTEQQAASAGGPASPAPVAGENIDLPPLGESDPVVRQLVGALSSHPKVAAWLATDQLIRNFAVVVVNISNGQSPAKHLRRLAPTGEFVAREDEEGARLDPRSYSRYDEYADAVGGLDAEGTARLYATLKPRIQEAYRELGHPEGDFDRALERAIVELLSAPIVEGDVVLTTRSVFWAYADPKLESLSSAQRQFLRMGPRNMRIVKAKLREIAPLIGISPGSLPG